MAKLVRAFAVSAALILTTAFIELPRTQPDRALQELARQFEPYKSVTYALNHGYRSNPTVKTQVGLDTIGYLYSN